MSDDRALSELLNAVAADWDLTHFSRRRFMKLAGTVGGLAVGGSTLAWLIEACGGSSTAATNTNATLTMAVFQEPDTLDPSASGLITVGAISGCIFDHLIWDLPGHGSSPFYAGLASSWEATPDATSYTFHLRKDVKFHDGTPFNAQAVKFTFDHIVDPNTKSKSAAGALGPYQDTTVVDDYTVKINFKSPNAAFMNEVATFSIVSPAAVQKFGADFGHNPVGTGPFKFKEYVVGQHVTVERNPDYNWGPQPLRTGPPQIKEIVFRILADPGARFNALQTGEINLAPNINPQDIQSIKSDPKFKVYNVDSTGMPWDIMVNAQKAPTNDPLVRQALEFATDQATIIKTLYFGLYKAADSVYTPITPGYDQATQAIYKYDKDKAGQLLDQAGWTKGSDGMRQKGGQKMKLSFINISGFGFDGISQLMQSQFKDVGIQVDISDQSFPAVADAYNRGDQHLADFFYYDVDPYFTRALFGGDQIAHGFNWEHYDNPDLTAQIDKANATADNNQRAELYKQVGKTIMEAAVIIPIYNSSGLFVGTSSIQGLAFTVNAFPLFHAVSM
ncbi:MAG TPA: ABC transporter substrate-binding protein [Candidatus Acidoferrum sp.]|nr:ABC transporter substrate-binding protein [Candidatus Acidoferrum sp.]